MTNATYADFLSSKAQIAQPAGFDDITIDDVHPILKPHQRDAVLWAIRGGRRALFESFGLGKTIQQLEIARLIRDRIGPESRALIVCPLGVKQEFNRDAALLDLAPPTFVRTTAEATAPGLYLTNYESVRERKLDPRGFDVVSLDEAAILRGFGGSKTFREMMRLYEGSSAYRFVATATPSPNDYIELLSYAAFLDVMDVGQAKTIFFKRDSEHADRLTLLPHMEDAFWHWVASWALFITRPSDLGYSDDGYELPEMDVRWHAVPSPPREVDFDRDGRGRLFESASMGVQEAAREKRESIEIRVAKMAEIIAADPDDHFLLWHDLEDERKAIAAAVPTAVSVWGSQDLDAREKAIIDFSDGKIPHLSTKPVIAGSGCNFQRHCHRAIFTGIGFKFADFIQAIHRIQRFQQTRPVRIDLIHTDAEAEIVAKLKAKWRRHEELVAKMTAIIRERGLAREAIGDTLHRSRFSAENRREAAGDHYRLVHNDTVLETTSMDADSVDLVLTSLPFSTQYEYSPSENDFGHNEDNVAFWAQMDYLTPQLLRVLKPGRIAAIHVKDRVVPGGMTGLGFQTIYPFSDDTIRHFTGHGFAFLARRTIVTDVVRENNQTYRLGWSEQCKDGTRMGAGLPEYLLLFRKPPTDASDGYADDPVAKDKATYTRARWQVDAHGFWRSNGNRHLTPEEFAGLAHDEMFRLFRDRNLTDVYEYEDHVAIGESLEAKRLLPTTFMLLQPPSWHPDVWTDVARMRTLNMVQQQKGFAQHLCPLQFDIVDRVIVQHTQPGETVYDPFGGIMTVPYCAVKLGRRGIGVELNPDYWRDGVHHLEGIAREQDAPTLFDLAEATAGDDVA